MADGRLVPMTVPTWQPTSPRPEWFAHDAYGIHGLAHERRVRVHAMAIAEALGADDRILRVMDRASAWHDIGRRHDGVDAAHGELSVRRVDGLGLADGEPSDLLDLESFVIRYHAMDDRLGLDAAAGQPDPAAAELALKIFKDADGLDRVRIHDLDVEHLRFGVSRAREEEAWRMLEEDQDS